MSATAQCMEALAKANVVRRANARLTEDLATLPYLEARVELARLILDSPGHVGSMPVERLLRACTGIGPEKAAKLLRLADASRSMRVGALTVRQRRVMAGELATRRRLHIREPA